MHHLTANLTPQLCPFSRSRPDATANLLIKQCPVCGIYIERNQGCAQMLCKSCKHTFCWYCLQNLDVSPPPSRPHDTWKKNSFLLFLDLCRQV